jgi:GTP diphosphokinase / guanosine-3',5'-bis(diphosphate) 3'-diphosphatase
MPKDFYKDIILPEGFDKKLVERAYKFAKQAHHGQKRRSGEPYITHPLAVAKTLLHLGMSDEMAAAALLHDVVEDTDTKHEEIESEFGVEVADLVKSLTALRQVDFSTYSNPEEAEEAKNHAKNENLRQLFLSMSEDVRVVIIKLADRLHNMETIKSLSTEHQQRVSRETLNIFAPLALRLGMGEIKGRLEDLAFPIAYPQEYKYLKKEANRRYKAADRYTLKVKRIIDDELKRLSVSADVEGRAKHIYSLYKKITRPEIDWDFDKVYDLVALRIVTDTEENCYKILGAIHGKFRPIPNYVRDYIAAPKPNGYRSIHTTVFGPEGKVCEIQIRTKEMHEEAEYGVASHLHYTLEKSSGKSDSELEKGTFAKSHQTDFLKRIKEWQVSVGDDSDFLEGLKMEFLDDRIYVFSPNGDIFDLPVGATPVDFAYEVHSRVGDRCVGAKVNKKIVSLDTELKTRDVVDIITAKKEAPKRGWLDFVKTSKAKQHIRSYYRKFDHEKNMLEGREIVLKELEILGYDFNRLTEADIRGAISETSFKTIDDLFASVGEGLTTRRQAVKFILGKTVIPNEPKKVSGGTKKPEMTNFEGMKINIAPCCTPTKNDAVKSYVTRGRGLTVHRADCSNLSHLEAERIFDFNPWQKGKILTEIEVLAEDRIGLIRDITNVISNHHINIENIANHHKPGSKRSRLNFKITVADLAECIDLVSDVAEIDNVTSVHRIS